MNPAFTQAMLLSLGLALWTGAVAAQAPAAQPAGDPAGESARPAARAEPAAAESAGRDPARGKPRAGGPRDEEAAPERPPAGPPALFAPLSSDYEARVRPLLGRYCIDCHSSRKRKGELDLERFRTFADVRAAPPVFAKVREMLALSEMPPRKRPQPTASERRFLLEWIERYRRAEARVRAGDPGPILARRLNNAEYTYTIRDLTGVDLDPAREFPPDGAAGEGFTNAADALPMSPALFTKFFDAAKDVARHAVLLPGGFRFSAGTTRREWTDEIVEEIRALYRRYADEEGRVDLEPYFSALIRIRDALLEDPGACERIASDAARRAGLSPRYLSTLARELAQPDGQGFLVEWAGRLWREAGPDAASKIARRIRSLADRMWRFEKVGHFGLIRPWQNPVPLSSERVELRHAIREEDSRSASGGDLVLRIALGAVGPAAVRLERPRFERPGHPPLHLRDLRTTASLLAKLRAEELPRTARYLQAARELERAAERPEPRDVARRSGLDARLFSAWLSLLGFEEGGAQGIEGHLSAAREAIGGYNFIKGWEAPGVADYSVVANASERTVRIPGILPGRRIAVHPRPERWIAAGWESPCAAKIRISVYVRDAHPECGNGVSWSLEHRRGRRTRTLAGGVVDRGGEASHASPRPLEAAEKDTFVLKIGPRDRNHACDLTRIDMEIEEVRPGGEAGRKWSLAGDCAGDLLAGNPHPDRYGNDAVWHFFGGPLEGGDETTVAIPPGSLLARWLDAASDAEADSLARALERLLGGDVEGSVRPEDAELRRSLRSLGGPLFSRIDVDTAGADPALLEGPPYGLDPSRFEGGGTDLRLEAPGGLEIRAPRDLVAGSTFACGVRIAEEAPRDAVVWVTAGEGRAGEREFSAFDPEALFLRHPEAQEGGAVERAEEAFRALFPRAVCYPRIVPVDEVITLVLFHREDEPLVRLLLEPAERIRLDRLWEELRYVSRDALVIVDAYEQLLEYATQDNDPRRFYPLRRPIEERAEAFRRELRASEPRHFDALLKFADRAWRRPLTRDEKTGLRDLYQRLRAEGLEHEAAVRLVLARVLAAPQFIFRIEKPAPGPGPGPVSPHELAVRLSYFLWSSLPDGRLREAADSGRLSDSKVLIAETRRMLRDPRARRLAVEFACQWLHIRGFDRFDEKNTKLFPDFARLRADLYEEAVLFFTDLFRRDGSILELLDADHTFLNEALARYYEIPAPEGRGFRRAEGVRRFGRGGILGFGAVLARHSGASRTSPVLRGAWIAETLLGEHLPRPPKNVPQLPETPPEGLTERALAERHAQDPACAKCHSRIDPYGFALEGYDTFGRRRRVDARGLAVETKARLPDGTEVDGLEGLRAYLRGPRRSAFVRQFARKLLGYALGRAVELSDEALLDDMARNLEKENWRFGAAVETIVLSPQFRSIRPGKPGRAGGAPEAAPKRAGNRGAAGSGERGAR